MHIAHESVKIPRVEVTGQLVLMSAEPDGVTVIRNALKKASESKTAGADIDLLVRGCADLSDQGNGIRLQESGKSA